MMFDFLGSKLIVFVWLRIAKLIFMMSVGVGLLGCLGSSPQKSFGSAKISPDGSLLAVMEFDEYGSYLKVKNLNKKTNHWMDVPLPIGAGSFNFSKSGESILITHREGVGGVLSEIKLNDDHARVEIYRSEFDLAFPNEISPGKYLVQAVVRITKGGYSMHQWRIVSLHGSAIDVGAEFGPPYGNVSVVRDSGFFIVTDADGEEKIRSFNFPGGTMPNIGAYVSSNTQDLICDEMIEVCIKKNRYLDDSGYFFKIFRVTKVGECELHGFPRWIRGVSFSKNGGHVLVVAAISYKVKPILEVVNFLNATCLNFTKTKLEY